MTTMTEALELRANSDRVRVDAADGSFQPILKGYAMVWGSLSEDLGGFREKINANAMTRTLEEKVDLRALIDHDSSKVIGRLSAGTLRVKADNIGLKFEIWPPNTPDGRGIVELVRRGDVDGMSFAFRTLRDEWDFNLDPPHRELLDIRCRELSVCAWPAYPATEVTLGQAARAANRVTVHDLDARFAAALGPLRAVALEVRRQAPELQRQLGTRAREYRLVFDGGVSPTGRPIARLVPHQAEPASSRPVTGSVTKLARTTAAASPGKTIAASRASGLLHYYGRLLDQRQRWWQADAAHAARMAAARDGR
jgi:uncharacterized protein